MVSSIPFNLGKDHFTMSVNHLHHLDKNVKDCYKYDFDWSLLLDNLRKVRLLQYLLLLFYYKNY